MLVDVETRKAKRIYSGNIKRYNLFTTTLAPNALIYNIKILLFVLLQNNSAEPLKFIQSKANTCAGYKR